MENIQIIVRSEVLVQEADRILSMVNRLKGRFDSMKTRIRNTEQYWRGEAGDQHRRIFAEYEGEMEEILKRFREHTEDLKKMAGVYEGGEKEAQKQAAALGTDIIR